MSDGRRLQGEPQFFSLETAATARLDYDSQSRRTIIETLVDQAQGRG